MKVYKIVKHPSNGLYYVKAFDAETSEPLPVEDEIEVIKVDEL